MVSNQLAVLLSSFALLGSAGLAAVLLLAWGWVAASGKNRLAGGVRRGLMGLIAGYGLALAGPGLMSRDVTLPVRAEKYFCEIDCHLAYRVTEARPAAASTGAAGTRWAVVLQTRFDETTISPGRGREAPLWPGPRHVALRDSAGHSYEPLPAGSGGTAVHGGPSTPLTRELRPGDSYRTSFIFDLPNGAAPAALLVEDAGWIDHLLIGGERSPWHGKVLLPVAAIGS